MAKRKKQTKPQDVSQSTLEEALRARGFTQSQAKLQKAAGRRVLKSGSHRVLMSSLESPWWTFQRTSGSTVDWFMDIPVEAPVESVLAFIDAFSKTPPPSAKEFDQMQQRERRQARLLDHCRNSLQFIATAIDYEGPISNGTRVLRGDYVVVTDLEETLALLDEYVDGEPEREKRPVADILRPAMSDD